MGLKQDSSLKSSEEAAMWLQHLRDRDTPEARAEFSAWVRKGANNLEEFLFAQAIWKELDHIDSETRQRLWSHEDRLTVVDFPVREPSSIDPARMNGDARRRRRSWLLSAAAVLAAVLVGWTLLPRFELGSKAYITALGEQKSVKLSDGSLMHLNTNSRAIVSFTDAQRVIRLISGEALFTVVPDANRPFYVLTDSARVRAVGTQFNVYRNGLMETRVAVVDGRVQVSSLTEVKNSGATTTTTRPDQPQVVQLEAGDEAEVDRGRVIKAKTPDIERAVSWRARKLIFPGNPVDEIVAQFNRYNSTPIRLEGEELQARRMSGVFDADDPSPLLSYLERDPGIEVIHATHEIVVRPRDSGT